MIAVANRLATYSFVGLAAVFVAACGGEPSTSPPREPGASIKPAQVPIDPAGKTVWGRRDAPPAGVLRQVQFFGIGDTLCPMAEKAGPSIVLTALPWGQRRAPDQAYRGDTVALCLQDFDPHLKVDVAATGPHGFARQWEVPWDAPPAHMTYIWLSDIWPAGRYTVTAEQGNIGTELRFQVSQARDLAVRVSEAYEVDKPRPEYVEAMIVGAPPSAKVMVDLYKLGDVKYEYVTSFDLISASDGVVAARLKVSQSDVGRFLIAPRRIGEPFDQERVALVAIGDS